MTQEDGPEYKVFGMNYRPMSRRIRGSSLERGTSEASAVSVLLIILSLGSLVLGTSVGVLGMPAFAASVVFAILARIAQAGRQHAEMMDELRKGGG